MLDIDENLKFNELKELGPELEYSAVYCSKYQCDIVRAALTLSREPDSFCFLGGSD